MKKPILITLLIILSSCTFTKQQKAEKLAKDYLMQHLNDPHSYESVSFSNLDTVKNNFTQTREYKTIDDSLIKIGVDLGLAKENLYDLSAKQIKHIISQRTKDSLFFHAKQDSIENSFKQTQTGWRLTHSYRAKNGFGGLGLHQSIFIVNKSCDSILDVIDSKD